MSLLTEKALAASLKKLLEKKTLDKITVKDITDDCGVNRQTFYYHFHDVYDLVEWIFTQEAKKYMSDGINAKNWQEVVTELMQGLLDDKRFIMNTYYSLNRRQLEQFMQKLARPAILDLVKQVAEDRKIEDEDVEFVADLFTFGLVGILTEWVAGDMNTEYKDKLDKFLVVIDGTMETTLDKFAK
jgi:Transcriptional regulator